MTKETTDLNEYAVSFMPFYTEYQGPTAELKDYTFGDTIYFRGKELQREKLATATACDCMSAKLSNGAILLGNIINGRIVAVNNYEREGSNRNELARLQELISLTNVINQ
ncbi:hypothetical protein SKDZ_12G2000 [Saccharomyces kudriavzevii ZP591]|nr:hypothetical protein SKDZ_12G2000 [Saccharomyces kudriavzevii ZP591]